MADAVGRVEVEISANTAQFEAALARARQLAAGLSNIQLGGGAGGAGSAAAALRNFNTHAGAASQAAAALVQQNHALAVAFRTVAGALSAIQGPLGPIAGRFGFLGTLIGRVGVGFAGFGVAVAGAVLSVNEAIDAFAEEEKQLLTLNAVLKATQGASGQTADSLGELADSISKTTLATDDQVRSAEGLLMTFRKLSGDEFPRALRAAQDLAATGFGSIEGNARQLGRALEDPIRGLGALRRSGVTFSESQRQVIRALVQSGNAVEAQRKVLEAIEIQVGGAGAAQAGGVAGAYHRLSEAVNNVTVVMGGWLERTFKVSNLADSAADALNSLVQSNDELAVSIGGVTYQTQKLETERERVDRKERERVSARDKEIARRKEEAQLEAVAQQVLRFGQAPQVPGKPPVTFQSGFEEGAEVTEQEIRLQKALTAVMGQFAQAISYANQWVTRHNADVAALAKSEDALNASLQEGIDALHLERDELMRTNEQRRVHDILVKNELDNSSAQAKALAEETIAQYNLSQAISALGAAGGPVDELKARYASMLAMMQQGAGIQMTNVGLLKVGIQSALMLTDEQIRRQAQADALSRSAKNASEQAAAARAQEAAKFVEGETEKQRAQRITIAGTKAELDGIQNLIDADQARVLQQQQNLEQAQLGLELVGKSIGEQTRLQQTLQLTQELERRRILEHIAYTKADIAAIDVLAAKMGQIAQETAEANLRMTNSFAAQSMFLSQTEQKVASAMQGVFGEEWQQHMHDAEAQQIRLNSILADTYSTTRDFAGTFAKGMLDGKSATDALTEALSNLQNKLIDMALDAVIQGLFTMLLGQGTAGGNIFSQLVGFASGGGTGGGNTTRQPIRMAQGGVVGSTPRPLYHGEPLAYDEYPAILHVGETVIPVGGKNTHTSGKDMTEMFGGIPKLEGGFNAAAAAAGAYTAGDTGATGSWSSVSGGGGNATLSSWQASQYTSSQAYGTGTYSGRGSGSIGGSIAPRIATAAPRVVPRVFVPAVTRQVSVPIVQKPLVRDFDFGGINPADIIGGGVDRATRFPRYPEYVIGGSGGGKVGTGVKTTTIIVSPGYYREGGLSGGRPGTSPPADLTGSSRDERQAITNIPPGVFDPGPWITPGGFPVSPWGTGTPTMGTPRGENLFSTAARYPTTTAVSSRPTDITPFTYYGGYGPGRSPSGPGPTYGAQQWSSLQQGLTYGRGTPTGTTVPYPTFAGAGIPPSLDFMTRAASTVQERGSTVGPGYRYGGPFPVWEFKSVPLWSQLMAHDADVEGEYGGTVSQGALGARAGAGYRYGGQFPWSPQAWGPGIPTMGTPRGENLFSTAARYPTTTAVSGRPSDITPFTYYGGYGPGRSPVGGYGARQWSQLQGSAYGAQQWSSRQGSAVGLSASVRGGGPWGTSPNFADPYGARGIESWIEPDFAPIGPGEYKGPRYGGIMYGAGMDAANWTSAMKYAGLWQRPPSPFSGAPGVFPPGMPLNVPFSQRGRATIPPYPMFQDRRTPPGVGVRNVPSLVYDPTQPGSTAIAGGWERFTGMVGGWFGGAGAFPAPPHPAPYDTLRPPVPYRGAPWEPASSPSWTNPGAMRGRGGLRGGAGLQSALGGGVLVAGGTDAIYAAAAMRGLTTEVGGSLDRTVNTEEPSTYDTMRAHTEDYRPTDILASAGGMAMDALRAYGRLFGPIVENVLNPVMKGIDYVAGTHLARLTPEEASAAASAISQQFTGPALTVGPGLPKPHLGSIGSLRSLNVDDRRPRAPDGSLLTAAERVPDRYKGMFPEGLPPGVYVEYDKKTGIPTGSLATGWRNWRQEYTDDQLKYGTGMSTDVLGTRGRTGNVWAAEHHGGGVVGSTPVAHRMLPANIFFRAPRFQGGLAADEYPAVLHAGETVTPAAGRARSGTQVVVNTPSQPPPVVMVNVINNSSANVSANSSQEANGNVKLDIMIDELVAAKMRDGGSNIARTMGTMGARALPMRR